MEFVDIHGMRCSVCLTYVRLGLGTDEGLWVYCDHCKQAWTIEEVIARLLGGDYTMGDGPAHIRSN